ncbi:MAG TPA: hypothetical protein VFW19_19045 [Allosphingosinicella sp.]|nr:hypothetical protein [Allosphingosinicella sp.]
MAAADLDLSGRWSGLYNYPHSMPPTPFEAEIREQGGLIAGETIEPGHDGGTMHAMISGRRAGHDVHFVKTYDDLLPAGAPIDYRGTVAEGGDEIEGRWTIAGSWSGTFLMIREGGSKEEAAAPEAAEIRL